jgi:hypothetical protein
MKPGTLFEIVPRKNEADTDETPIFPDPEGCKEKLGWLHGHDIMLYLGVGNEPGTFGSKRVKVLSRLGVGWVSIRWIQAV